METKDKDRDRRTDWIIAQGKVEKALPFGLCGSLSIIEVISHSQMQGNFYSINFLSMDNWYQVYLHLTILVTLFMLVLLLQFSFYFIQESQRSEATHRFPEYFI